MFPAHSNDIDISSIWTFVFLAARMGGLFMVLPGIGTESVSQSVRTSLAIAMAIIVTMTGIRAEEPPTLLHAILMIASEASLGFALGLIPSVLLGGLAVSGQVVSGAIGLGQANMMDRSLGGNFAILANIQVKIATIIFLAIDGHHAVLRAACGVANDIGIGMFNPGIDTATVLVNRFVRSFDLALMVAAPILVTTLLTQFVLGLITKFVPTVNIFIISLPLNIIVGLYITAYTYPGFADHLLAEFGQMEEYLALVLKGG